MVVSWLRAIVGTDQMGISTSAVGLWVWMHLNASLGGGAVLGQGLLVGLDKQEQVGSPSMLQPGILYFQSKGGTRGCYLALGD